MNRFWEQMPAVWFVVRSKVCPGSRSLFDAYTAGCLGKTECCLLRGTALYYTTLHRTTLHLNDLLHLSAEQFVIRSKLSPNEEQQPPPLYQLSKPVLPSLAMHHFMTGRVNLIIIIASKVQAL